MSPAMKWPACVIAIAHGATPSDAEKSWKDCAPSVDRYSPPLLSSAYRAVLPAGSTASACTVMFGRPRGWRSFHVLPASVLTASAAEPSAAVLAAPFRTTGLAV